MIIFSPGFCLLFFRCVDKQTNAHTHMSAVKKGGWRVKIFGICSNTYKSFLCPFPIIEYVNMIWYHHRNSFEIIPFWDALKWDQQIFSLDFVFYFTGDNYQIISHLSKQSNGVWRERERKWSHVLILRLRYWTKKKTLS